MQVTCMKVFLLVYFEPCMGKNTSQVSHYDCNAAGVTSYHDVIDAIAWNGDLKVLVLA